MNDLQNMTIWRTGYTLFTTDKSDKKQYERMNGENSTQQEIYW